jgi:protein-S-isoprenylcysteine O-methyltransferase Ste14
MKNRILFLMHVPVPWVFVLIYLLGVALESGRPTPRFPMIALASTITGGVVFVVGAVIAGWGLAIFHKAHTTTVPGQSSVRLVTWGPYRFTRNPMYLGLVLA